MRALDLDDSLVVVRTLASGAAGETQLVRRASKGAAASCADDASGAGAATAAEGAVPIEPLPAGGGLLLVRKYIPIELANRRAWEVARDICDPRLPRIRLMYELPDRLAVVYDYVEGESLAARVAESGALDASEAVAVAIELCAAVGLLHDRGVVHRDISPGNVILAPGGAHLIDLGIARARTEGAHHDTTRLGTWGFAAPEQYGFAQTDARSDVYSLGRLLGYMLTGTDPTDPAYETRLGATDPRMLRIVERACAFEPSARYQSAGEMAAALGGVRSAASHPVARRRSGSDGQLLAGGALRGRGSRIGGVARRLLDRASSFLACLREARGWRRAVAVLLLAIGVVSGLLIVMAAVTLVLHPKRSTDAFSAALALETLVLVELGVVYYPITCLLSDATVSPSRSVPPRRRLKEFLGREARLLLACLLVFAVLTILAMLVIGPTSGS